MTGYRDAVRAIAESITSDEDLTEEQKTLLARKILNEHGLTIHKDAVDFGIDSVSLTFSNDAREALRQYLTEIQQARQAEIGQKIEASLNNAKRLKSLKDELRNDLSQAYDEDRELQRIAEMLKDHDIGKVAGKEEHQINELGRKLEQLNSKGQMIAQLEDTLETVLENRGVDITGLESELHERAERVSTILREDSMVKTSGSGSPADGPYDGKYGRPSPDEPWIISISDVESDYGFMREALSLLERHGWSPIVSETGRVLEWTGGDKYRFVMNGDLLDRGDEPGRVWQSVFNILSSGRGEMTMGNHDRPILIPKARIKKEQRVHSTAIGEGLGEFPPAGDEVELASLIYDADNGDISRDFGMKRQFAEAIMNDNIKMMAEGYHYFYVHGGARYASQDKMKQANSALKKLVAEPILEDISNGSRSNEEEINDRISRRDGRYQMLFGLGDDSTRDETAGMTWMAWENIPGDAGNQIVGHTGVDSGVPEQRNGGQVINGNTSASSGRPSVIVETPEGVFALVEGRDEPLDLVGY